jgi:hypothetical protein
MYCDSTVPFPFGATVASRAEPSSMPPVATGAVSSFFLLLLADLHPVQGITPWHLATTLPPPSCPHASIFTSSSEARWSRSSPVPGHTTYRDPRSYLLSTGCMWNNVGMWQPHPYPAPSHFGSGVSATFTCSLSRSVITGSLRQPRRLSEKESAAPMSGWLP